MITLKTYIHGVTLKMTFKNKKIKSISRKLYYRGKTIKSNNEGNSDYQRAIS